MVTVNLDPYGFHKNHRSADVTPDEVTGLGDAKWWARLGKGLISVGNFSTWNQALEGETVDEQFEFIDNMDAGEIALETAMTVLTLFGGELTSALYAGAAKAGVRAPAALSRIVGNIATRTGEAAATVASRVATKASSFAKAITGRSWEALPNGVKRQLTAVMRQLATDEGLLIEGEQLDTQAFLDFESTNPNSLVDADGQKIAVSATSEGQEVQAQALERQITEARRQFREMVNRFDRAATEEEANAVGQDFLNALNEQVAEDNRVRRQFYAARAQAAQADPLAVQGSARQTAAYSSALRSRTFGAFEQKVGQALNRLEKNPAARAEFDKVFNQYFAEMVEENEKLGSITLRGSAKDELEALKVKVMKLADDIGKPIEEQTLYGSAATKPDGKSDGSGRLVRSSAAKQPAFLKAGRNQRLQKIMEDWKKMDKVYAEKDLVSGSVTVPTMAEGATAQEVAAAQETATGRAISQGLRQAVEEKGAGYVLELRDIMALRERMLEEAELKVVSMGQEMGRYEEEARDIMAQYQQDIQDVFARVKTDLDPEELEVFKEIAGDEVLRQYKPAAAPQPPPAPLAEIPVSDAKNIPGFQEAVEASDPAAVDRQIASQKNQARIAEIDAANAAITSVGDDWAETAGRRFREEALTRAEAGSARTPEELGEYIIQRSVTSGISTQMQNALKAEGYDLRDNKGIVKGLVKDEFGNTVVGGFRPLKPRGDQETGTTAAAAAEETPLNEVSSDEKTTEMFTIKKELNYENFDVLLREAVSLCQAANDDDADFEEGQYMLRRDVFGKRLKHHVLFSQKEGELSITFAGMDEVAEDTINETDGNLVSHYSNLKALLQNPHTKMGFHAACLRALNTAYPIIRAELDKFSGEYLSFNIFGASSGGSMATIFYWLYIHDDVRPQKKMEVKQCITLGAPRTVVDDFHNEDDYNAKCPNLLRVWNTMDVETYRPFKNEVIDNVMKVPSNFVHVGKPFCVDSNYETQNANLLVVSQLQPSTKLIASLLKKFDFDEQLALSDIVMSSGWQSLLAQCCVHLLGRAKPRPEIPMLAFSEMCGEWMTAMMEAPSLASRVSYLQGFGFEQLSESTYLKELDGTSQSFSLASLAIVSMAAIRRETVMGTVGGYRAYIDSLILREVEERKPITDRVEPKTVKQMGDWREYGVSLVPAV